MAKNPENMTPEERLTRIKSLERKVADLDYRLRRAEEASDHTDRWAQEAFDEQRRLHTVLEKHWAEKNEYRKAAGLDPVERYAVIRRLDDSGE